MKADVPGLVRALYDAVLDGALWPNTLQTFADRFNSSHAILAVGSAASCAPDVVWAGVERPFQELYARSFVNGNNTIQLAARREFQDEPYTDWMALPDGSFQRSAFFQDWCRPQQIQTLLGAEVIHDARGIALLGLGRPEPYGDSELSVFRKLMPDLRRIMGLRLRLFDVDLQRARLRALLDAVSTPILLTDSACCLLHANHRAEYLLRAGGVLHISQNRLAAPTEHETDMLRRVVRSAGANNGGASLRLEAANGTHAGVSVVPVHADHGWAEGSEVCVAIFVTGSAEYAAVEPSLLTALYGLTPTEAAVAAMLGRGDGLPATASALGMKTSTARTHLHRIFDKTATQRQAQLVALLRSLPRRAVGAGLP
jgi:DNA-binding CsgD family transcriptional regulator/PAS domain-containing protein